MRRVLGIGLGLLAYTALGLAIAPFAPSGAIAQVAPPCGTPAWTASPGAPLNAANINSELNHLESCAASGAGAAPNITPSAPISATIVGTSTVLSLAVTGSCLVIVGGALSFNTTACPTAGPQATPSPAPSDSAILITGSWPYAIGLNPSQPDQVVWNNIFNVNYNASTGCQNATSGAPTAEACFDGTSSIGLDVGPVNGSYSSGSANSQELCVSRLSSGTLANACTQLSSAGILSLNAGGGANSISTANTTFTTGTAIAETGYLGQVGTACATTSPVTGAAGTYACAIKAAASAWSFTFGQTYTATTHPMCFTSDETTGGGSTVTAYAGSTGAWTGCSGVATTNDIVDVLVIGNPH